MKFVEEKPNAEETIKPKTKLPNAEDVVQPKRMKKRITRCWGHRETEPTKTGNDFAKLTKKAITLGATALNYSNRKNTKDFVTLEDGKRVHFGSVKKEDYHDKERRKKYLARAKKITNNSANYWSIRLLWYGE